MTFHLAENLVVHFAKNRSLMVEFDIHRRVLIFASFSLHIMKRAHVWLQNWFTSFFFFLVKCIKNFRDSSCVSVPKLTGQVGHLPVLGSPNPLVCLNTKSRLSNISGEEQEAGLSLEAGAGLMEKVFCWLWSWLMEGNGVCCGHGVTCWCHFKNPAAISASQSLTGGVRGVRRWVYFQLPLLPVLGHLSSWGSSQKNCASACLTTSYTSHHA